MKKMTLQEIKDCSIGVLNFIDEVCRENNLHYYLCGGSLLGAVRHKGFIPWDDDIDIMMPRSDYVKLFEIWPQNTRYSVLNYKNTKDFLYAYGKAIDLSTVKKESITACQLGVDVDIFPIDGLPSDDKEARAYYKIIERIQRRLTLQLSSYGRGSTLVHTVARNILIFFLKIFSFLDWTSLYKVIKRFDKVAQRYTGKNTGYCGVTAISHYGIKEKNPVENYRESVFVTFEGKEYPAPIGYADYLSRLYGKDYMQLPPEDMRKSHHNYEAYWK